MMLKLFGLFVVQKNNLLLRLTFKCVACCLYCLEKTLQYITAYCYIYTAMQAGKKP